MITGIWIFIIIIGHVLGIADMQVLPRYTFSHLQGNQREGVDREVLIVSYFYQGYSYNEIIFTLLSVHGISLCLRQLKRIIAGLGLKRKVLHNEESPIDDIVTALQEELQNSGQCLGYRAMWRRLIRDYHIKVRRETVRRLLLIIDPEGVTRRKHHRLLRRTYTVPGPNFLWHVDGFDKIKPYGFAIHGAIDGYSRRVLWLEVSSTNNDPTVIAWHYLSCVQSLGHVPRILRCDLGTENASLKFLQPFFRSNCNDSFGGLKSFMCGKSTSNQRIEAFWSILRKQCIDWWMNLFKELSNRGLYKSHDPVHAECLRFCFINVLQIELHSIAADWNMHTIRHQHNAECPSGKPDIIYFTPELYDSHDYGIPVEVQDVAICKGVYGKEPPRGYSNEFMEIVGILRPNIAMPKNANEAIDIYVDLITEIERYSNNL